MEENEENIIENKEDITLKKQRTMSLRGGRKNVLPNYEYNLNPMDPIKDGKEGKAYKIFSFLSNGTIVGVFVALVAMIIFITSYISGLYDFDSAIGRKKTPYATVMITQKYGEKFYAKSYKSSSNMYKEYEAYPENNPDILFFLSHTMHPNGRHEFKDNYLSKAFEYYLPEFEGDLSKLSISTEGDKPEIVVDTTYETMEADLQVLYDLKQFLISKSIAFEQMYFTIRSEHFYETTYGGKYLKADTSFKNFILGEKNFYILYLDENNLDLSEISFTDIQNYRPPELAIELPYKKIPKTTTVAKYDYSRQDYILDMTKIVPFIKNSKFLNEENMLFTIDGKEYKTDKEISASEFEKTFNAYIKLNIKSGSLTILFRNTDKK